MWPHHAVCGPGLVTLKCQHGCVMWSIACLRLISMADEQMAVLIELFGGKKVAIANLWRTIVWF